jgi:hypothetical protein
VLCDTDTLTTLPDRELASGISEIVKWVLLGGMFEGTIAFQEFVWVYSFGRCVSYLTSRLLLFVTFKHRKKKCSPPFFYKSRNLASLVSSLDQYA